MGGSESWTYEEVIHTSSSGVAVTKQILSEVTKHVEGVEAGGDNASNMYIKPQRPQKMSARFLLSTISCPITVAVTTFSILFVLPGS